MIKLGICLMAFTLSNASASIHVGVASNSPPKITAVKTAFSRFFPNENIHVHGFTCPSGVREQPFGQEEAEKGLTHRMDCLEDFLDKFNYTVSLENFIDVDQNNTLYDQAAVRVFDCSSKSEKTTLSEKVWLPKIISKQYLAHFSATNNPKTLGSFMEKTLNLGVQSTNWHEKFHPGRQDRIELLQDTIFKNLAHKQLDFVKSKLKLYPDFPKKGILFQDMMPILSDARALNQLIDLLAMRLQNQKIDKIVGLDSRGFLLGVPLALKLGVGFVPVRKQGKLPGEVFTASYTKEYGTDIVELHKDSLQVGEKVVIIDDLIATGGSANAAIELVKKSGAAPILLMTMLEVPELKKIRNIRIPTFNLLDL